jgi:glycosyltransferase involved in cell wall biosynthesis
VTRDLVTTIIPVFNRAAMLRDAVASVLAQTYRPIEIVIVDDGSTDDTARVAGELADGDVVRVIHQANGGVGAARETGRLAARGEFIQHLDSDDVLLPSKFARQVAGLRANPDCGASYGWTRWPGQPHPAKRTGERIEMMFPAMLQSRFWETTSPLYRRDLIDRAGAWLPLRMEEDWEYDARIAALGVKLDYVADWVSEIRRHDEGHLSGRGGALHDRAVAHESIYASARRAGIGEDAPEMRHFARELFLLARQCGADGLTDDSQRLFALAREASGREGDRAQFRMYEAVARVIGWRGAGRLAELIDRVRL